jgi:hypothetical protein
MRFFLKTYQFVPKLNAMLHVPTKDEPPKIDLKYTCCSNHILHTPPITNKSHFLMTSPPNAQHRYLERALLVLESSSQRAVRDNHQARHECHLALGNYLDVLFRGVHARVRSPEWVRGVRHQNEREKELKWYQNEIKSSGGKTKNPALYSLMRKMESECAMDLRER